MHTYRRPHPGFTLAELLIALAILGVIATFTIPKVLQSQQNGQFKAEAKEASSMISGAFSAYQQQNVVTANMTSWDLTPYLNYVALDSSRIIDKANGSTSQQCQSPASLCLILHNGGVLMLMDQGKSFGGTGSTNAMDFYFDPDGTYGGATNGPSKSVRFFLYANGRISTLADMAPNTQNSNTTYSSCSTCDPTWFNWN